MMKALILISLFIIIASKNVHHELDGTATLKIKGGIEDASTSDRRLQKPPINRMRRSPKKDKSSEESSEESEESEESVESVETSGDVNTDYDESLKLVARNKRSPKRMKNKKMKNKKNKSSEESEESSEEMSGDGTNDTEDSSEE